VNGLFYTRKVPDQDFVEYRAGTPVRDSERHIKRFVEELESWRMCTFDTEGNAELSYIEAEKTVGCVFVCYGSPITWSVLCFHDARDTLPSIRQIL
jgi:hypothetical protein